MTRNANNLALALLTFGPVSWAQSSEPNFDWTTIEPSTSLSWVDCYQAPLQCARFEVPLNHSQPEDGKTAAIAVIKYPAAANASTQGGPIFFNPGGPGTSGVEMIVNGGAGLQKIVGTHFDFVSFDPRGLISSSMSGIGSSTPKVSVFNSIEEATQFVAGEVYDLNSTSTAIEEQYERYQLFGKMAAKRDVDGFLSHVSTDNVARDMLSLAESMGQEKLQYWGLSYGSALGTIFATMFPVRLVGMDNYLGNDLGNHMADTDKAMQWFVEDCVTAGPEACPLHASSSAEVNVNLNSLLEAIRANPIGVELDSNTTITITYDGLRSVIVSTLNNVGDYQTLATDLKQLSEGNGTMIATAFTVADQNQLKNNEAYVAVACSDPDPLDMGPSELRKYMADINSTFAGMVAVPGMAQCAGWKAHPESRFKGPVGANTSFPLLVIGNTA
ncbi:hypothetical protein PQX77_002276, partial [Marasmius sp. AFHP31]